MGINTSAGSRAGGMTGGTRPSVADTGKRRGIQVTTGGKDLGISKDRGPSGIRGHSSGRCTSSHCDKKQSELWCSRPSFFFLWKSFCVSGVLLTQIRATPAVYCLLPSPGGPWNYNHCNPRLILQRMNNKLLAEAGIQWEGVRA